MLVSAVALKGEPKEKQDGLQFFFFRANLFRGLPFFPCSCDFDKRFFFGLSPPEGTSFAIRIISLDR